MNIPTPILLTRPAAAAQAAPVQRGCAAVSWHLCPQLQRTLHVAGASQVRAGLLLEGPALACSFAVVLARCSFAGPLVSANHQCSNHPPAPHSSLAHAARCASPPALQLPSAWRLAPCCLHTAALRQLATGERCGGSLTRAGPTEGLLAGRRVLHILRALCLADNRLRQPCLWDADACWQSPPHGRRYWGDSASPLVTADLATNSFYSGRAVRVDKLLVGGVAVVRHSRLGRPTLGPLN